MKNPPVLTRIAIRYQDLDPYGHFNNAVYLEFFEEIRIAYWRALANLMGFELRTGETFEGGPAVAKLEGRPEESFAPGRD